MIYRDSETSEESGSPLEKTTITVKKYFQDLLSSQPFFFCQINLNNLFSSDNLSF